MKIAVNPGHANNTGARGNGLEEHAIAAAVAPLVVDLLRKAGHDADVIDHPELTNAGDLSATARAINTGGYDLSVSLHCDASDNENAQGAHVCYLSEKGKQLASSIARRLCALLPGRAEQIVKRAGLYILKATNCPAVLVEMGFITNAFDAAMMKFRKHAIAATIADGILAYIETLDN